MSTRINVVLSVSGILTPVRFDDSLTYDSFWGMVDRGGSSLTLLTGQANERIWVRPSSVDSISEGAST